MALQVSRFYISRVLCLIIITSHLKIVLYKSISDNLGNRINSLSETFVEYASNECDLETFTNFSRDRLPQLYELLESSRTAKQSEAAMLSYTTSTSVCVNILISPSTYCFSPPNQAFAHILLHSCLESQL